MLLWDQVIYFYLHIQASFLLSVHNTLLSLINIQSLYFHEFHLVCFLLNSVKNSLSVITSFSHNYQNMYTAGTIFKFENC